MGKRRTADQVKRLLTGVSRDPPPDLVIEVDIPDRSAKRMRVLAALGVPEVW